MLPPWLYSAHRAEEPETEPSENGAKTSAYPIQRVVHFRQLSSCARLPRALGSNSTTIPNSPVKRFIIFLEMLKLRILALSAASLLWSVAIPALAQNAQLASSEINARVESLLKQMTLEEKIGQTVQYSAGFAPGPSASKLTYDELVANGHIGTMLNEIGADRTSHFQ